ncbi:hypothetical protein TA3x_002610 [Tundrisphaera sp. TA3]|uniref:hypothetical protein n=1 Tax=Tundrisphaera sp. TA3 TaxID=3435775 RepID=UPI003EB74364
MRLNTLSLCLVAPTLATSFGCASTMGVRYVYQDGDYGVVGMPENSNVWPTYYRKQADKLMAAHFPEGHEIVRAEEVVEGSRTLKLEGSRTAEMSPAIATAGLKVAKLGGTSSRVQADTTKITESRIIYKRAGGPVRPNSYADAPGLTPTFYLDPNAAERRKGCDPPAKVAESESKPEPPLKISPRGDG